MNQDPLQKIRRADWPEVINDIAEIVGDEAALNLFIRFQGRHLVAPKTFIPNHVIVQTIGEEKAALFIGHFGGDHLKIPNGNKLLINLRNNEIIEDFVRGGMKQCDLATKYRLTDRHISTIINTHSYTGNKHD